MKILYGIQGTGHGHISRAREILPHLAEHAELDVLISGTNCKLTIAGKRTQYRHGLSLTYDSEGKVSYLKTALNLHPITFLQDVHALRPDRYDLIISDFEPVSAWASILSSVPSVAVSHQAAFLSDRSPRPAKRSPFSEQILKRFAPCNYALGFHFRAYDHFISPPVIRREIQKLSPVAENHITVYLPAFDHQTLTSIFLKHSQTEWHIFSPYCEQQYRKQNVWVRPVSNEPFLESFQNCRGIVAGAGFETCAEAMFLGKKLMAIPIGNQYEQQCNAAALQTLGAYVVPSVDGQFNSHINNWLKEDAIPSAVYPADISHLSRKLLRFARRVHTHPVTT